MKIKTILCAVFAATLMGSCNYDDGELWDAVNGQEERISALEKWQKTVVEQLNSLQGILTATDYITDVDKVTKDGKEGYKISFLHAAPITLYYNDDKEVSGTGENVIGVAEEDGTGKWYWTLDGEALKVDDKTVYVNGGDDIKVVVNQDGSTTLTIGNNEVTVPGPITHPITGVIETDNVVTVTLNDGVIIDVPKYLNLSQYLDDSYIGQSQTVDYVLSCPDGCIIKVLDELPDGWKIEFKGKTMSVTYPASGTISVTFLISDGSTQTIMKSVSFDAGEKVDIVWTTVTYDGTNPITVNPGIKHIKVVGNATGLDSKVFAERIINPIKVCQGIIDVDLSGVTCSTQFPTNAFYANTQNPETNKNTTLETVVLPKGIVAVWARAFMNCVALKTVTIPTKPTGNMAYFDDVFTGCDKLESIFVPAADVQSFKENWPIVAEKIKQIPDAE